MTKPPRCSVWVKDRKLCWRNHKRFVNKIVCSLCLHNFLLLHGANTHLPPVLYTSTCNLYTITEGFWEPQGAYRNDDTVWHNTIWGLTRMVPIITARQRSCGMVMFTHVSVIPLPPHTPLPNLKVNTHQLYIPHCRRSAIVRLRRWRSVLLASSMRGRRPWRSEGPQPPGSLTSWFLMLEQVWLFTS